MRRTIGLSALATPTVSSGTPLRPLRVARRDQQILGPFEAPDRLEALDRREDELERSLLVGRERVRRADPEAGDRLVVVVPRRLVRGRGGDEEARVVATGR